MSFWFISDIHLKSQKERNGEKLLRFLHFIENEAQNEKIHLFFLGDIFDFWVSDHQVFQRTFSNIIEICLRLKSKNVELYFFEGNHDLHLANFWNKKMGFQVFTEPHYFNFDNFTIRCEHGDLINIHDEAYKKFRKFVRHPIIEFLGHHLPGFFWNWLGHRLSQHSSKSSRVYRVEHNVEMVKMIRAHAQRSYNEKPFQYIITGHMHIRDEFQFGPENKVCSINLGTWLTEDVYALKIHNQHYEWVKL